MVGRSAAGRVYQRIGPLLSGDSRDNLEHVLGLPWLPARLQGPAVAGLGGLRRQALGETMAINRNPPSIGRVRERNPLTDPPTPEPRDPLRPNRRDFGLGVLAAVALGTATRAEIAAPHPFGDEFPNLDSLAVGEWWKKPPPKGPNAPPPLDVPRDQVVAFALYTVDRGVLKLSAQLYPLRPDEPREARLEVERDGRWVELRKRRSSTPAGAPTSASGSGTPRRASSTA